MQSHSALSIPDAVTIKLIEAISCLSNASDLLQEGSDPFDSHVRFWLLGASDDLVAVLPEREPAEVHRELKLILAEIEKRSQRALEWVTSVSIDGLHGRLAKALRAHRSSPLGTRQAHHV